MQGTYNRVSKDKLQTSLSRHPLGLICCRSVLSRKTRIYHKRFPFLYGFINILGFNYSDMFKNQNSTLFKRSQEYFGKLIQYNALKTILKLLGILCLAIMDQCFHRYIDIIACITVYLTFLWLMYLFGIEESLR